MKVKKVLPALLFLGVAVGIGIYLTTEISSNTVYYYTVGEALNQEQNTKSLRVSGNVRTGSIVRDAEKMTLDFVMYDADGKELPVDYTGPIPDIFADEVEVIVEGKIADGRFAATNLLAKCPSKYEKTGAREDFQHVELPSEMTPGATGHTVSHPGMHQDAYKTDNPDQAGAAN